VMRMPRMQFEGLMTFPTAKPETRQYLERALQLLNGAGIPVPVISGGGSPSIGSVGEFPMLTEYRAGTYIYNDVMQVTTGAVTWDDCAMKVRATVVSRPTDDRAILDAGSKVLTHDQYYAKGYGRIVEYPDAQIVGFSEEHGNVDLTASARKPKVGEVVSVIPNHCCVVTNMVDEIHGVRGGKVEVTWPVAARGKVR
jgi:D-serine deaminase-like pyridoxal phosphate-dependent protein